MPRRQFIADLKEASETGTYPLLTNVAAGDDDGTISCTFAPQDASPSIDIQLLIPDISDYPDSHDCMVFTTTTEEVSGSITEALDGLQSRLFGLSVSDMLLQLTAVLQRAVARSSGSGSFDNADDDSDDAMDVDQMSNDESVGGGLGSDDEDDWFAKSPTTNKVSSLDDALKDHERTAELAARMASDLAQAKLSGFKVGYLGSKTAPIICLSCRIGKLGISDEAMEAWHVDGQQYLVCMIRYTGRYRSLEEIIQEEGRLGRASVDVHIDLCDSYKPTHHSAVSAFNQHHKSSSEKHTVNPSESKDNVKQGKSGQIVHSFISKPLNNLLRDRFVKILRCRYLYGFSWEGGERFFNDVQGKSADDVQLADEQYLAEEQVDSHPGALSTLVTSDHLIEGDMASRSFPLIAMQFALRHFVRCTEFCLVCHCKTNDAFEALKPYVCSNNLCLFQYMALGFGPSLEWEILSQPYVVDLLISFTYASAKNNRLFDFPTGLGFLVPLASLEPGDYPPNSAGSVGELASQRGEYEARFNRDSMELIFPSDYPSRPVNTGSWIVIMNPYNEAVDLHCRVRDASCWPTIRLSKPITRPHNTNPGLLQKPKPENEYPHGFHDVIFAVYENNFDTLRPDEQRAMVSILLETLPTVLEMQVFLSDTSASAAPVLASWHDRIPKPALDILRWIVASNRSCIVQENVVSSSRTGDDRVQGLDDYMQFRFAQGAPDKEQRFVQSVAAATAKDGLTYPTLFAWHGSSLSNWHGIVREGLHFRDTLHGRAFGHGVYMSPDFGVSSGYMSYSSGRNCTWPQSVLKPTNAISLNEVVNKPSQFVSKHPHLVVSQLDWIQTRYLFVQCAPKLREAPDNQPSDSVQYYDQDPAYTASGPGRKPIAIPMTAFSKQRRSTLQPAGTKGPTPEKNLQQKSRERNSASTAPKLSISSPSLPAVPEPKKRKGRFTMLFKSLNKENGPTGSAEKEKEEETTQDAVFKQFVPGEFNDPYSSDDTEKEDLEILFPPQHEGKGKQPAQNSQQSSSGPKASNIDSKKTDFVPGTLEESSLPMLGPPTYATPGASKTLQRELKSTMQIQESHPLHELGWYVDPNLVSTVYQWIVELHSFDKSLPIAKDLRKAGLKSVVLEIRFSKDYPISPPFVRVIRPRFLGFQQGGGGHVTAGGALCMELLTNSGWSAVSNIESVLLQVRMAVSSTEPHPARLESGQDAKKGTVREYGVSEAVSAYVRACRMHGWEVPPDFERLATAGWQASMN